MLTQKLICLELALAMSSSAPFNMGSPFVMGAGLAVSSSGSTPVESFLNVDDYFDLPLFGDDSRPSTSGAGPSFSQPRAGSSSSVGSSWWEDQGIFCRNKQKLFVSLL